MKLDPDETLRELMFPNAFEVIPGPLWIAEGRQPGIMNPSAVTSICVSGQSRFGNSVKQFRNAVNLAGFLGVRNLYLPSFSWISPGVHLSEMGFQIVNAADQVYADESTVLVAKLFFDPAGVRGRQKRSAFEVIRRHRDILSLPLDQPALPQDHLVIHIRSGDVFAEPAPARYGQPPLSFYLRVIQEADWQAIHIVAEDDRNPVIGELTRLLAGRAGFSAHVGRTLEEDLALLFRARTLVSSNGTFCRAISAISGNLEKVYVFQGKFDRWGNRGLELIHYIDKGKTYADEILDGNWKNTPEQIRLMLDYPEREIGQQPQPSPH